MRVHYITEQSEGQLEPAPCGRAFGGLADPKERGERELALAEPSAEAAPETLETEHVLRAEETHGQHGVEQQPAEERAPRGGCAHRECEGAQHSDASAVRADSA